MALAEIPASVLSKIMSLIFDFLWSGRGSNQHFHLVSWEVISKSKSVGGWVGHQEHFKF
jgi:hypothetical protein